VKALSLYLGASALALALAAGVTLPAAAQTKTTPSAQLTPPPTPSPAPSAAELPYPAYGTPAPDVAALRPVANVPTQITLEQAIAIAAAGSPTFASERAQYDAIRAKYGAAQGALFPAVSADASATRSFGGSSNNGNNNNAGNTVGNNTQISIQGHISQLIFDGGRVLAGLKSAKESNLSGALDLNRNLQTLQYDVANAYFAVLQAQAAVNAANQSVRQFQVTEDSINAQIRAGAAAKSDVAQAQFQTAHARGLLVTAQGQEIAAQSTFAATLGLDADTEVVPTERPASALPSQSPSYVKSLAQAFLLRDDYLAAQHDVNAANANVRFAKLAKFPSINASYSDGVTKDIPFQQTFSHGASLGATLTIPIFDQNQTNYAIAQAVSQRDQANAALVLAKLGVEQQVRTALSGVISSDASLTQAQLELAAAKVALSAAQARYRVGVATILDLVTAEANYSQAQTDYVNALYATQTAEQTYDYAVGTTGLSAATP
jgi:outer membrane protein